MGRFERNVRLYPWYVAAFSALFWLPVFFLYFNAHLPLRQVLWLEAIYYAAVVLLELPSGYFSDAVGRRPTLLCSAAALLAAYCLFFAGSSFTAFAIAQLFLATGISFNSGTNVSFHYDSLASLDREHEFPEREARVARDTFVATALAALVGGCVAAVGLRWAYALSALAAATCLTLVLLFAEPVAHERATMRRDGVTRQLTECLRYLQRPALLWLFAFAVLMTVINHIPHEFYQPYIRLLAARTALPETGTPLATGIHTALTMLAGSWLAARSIRLRDRIGLGPMLLTAAGLQVLIMLTMGLLLHPVIVVLVLLRSGPRALMTAPLNAAIAPVVAQHRRATYLSMQSLAGRLAFSGTLVGLSSLVPGEPASEWATLSTVLLVAAGFGAGGAILLALTSQALRHRPRHGTS